MMTTSVLIIGSGPTGLIMASRLKSLGISVRIIDALEHPKTTSRAFTIHARTLELLGQMGLADIFIARGLKTLSMDYHFPMQEETPRLDFTQLDSVFPFCLSINQAETEAILREYATSLGIEIEWNTRLDSFSVQDPEPLNITLHHLDTDRSEEVAADWLIGCDGHFSTVRQQLNISLEGDEYAGTMRMIDTRMTGFTYPDTAVHYFVAKDQMLLVHKLPGENHRLLISDRTEGVPPEQARSAFQSVLDQQFAGQVQIDEPVWATNFRLSKRQVSSYRQGSVFLAGDAAHVNSPAGGQGMNVAMQDAFNLSWKLAMVIKGKAHPTLLDSYEAERAPVASQMLEGTNYIHSIIMAHGQGMQERINRMRGGEWNKQAVNQVAGISYTYRVPTTRAESEPPNRILTIGDRAPDIVLSPQNRVYDGRI
jgi:2-polyprenyl-6-methoxyphenol hydroxylase-like FAD-dependent oxidoreductase